MTTAEREEYVTDVPYMRCFVGDLSPSTLRLVAALNGFPPPAGDHFDYCELGSAHGDTTATLAAAYPGARFFGVDINPEHVASADALASRGGLANVRFLERDFETLLDDELPPLDFMAAHGVLTWISAAKRKAMLDVAARKLKRGGLLYVGYNALPGWAAVEPLRQLMLDRADAVGGSSLDRARAALGLAIRLRDAGAQYFVNNPAAKEMLATMEEVGLSYIVHEYLHAHWTPMYFAQVAREMAESDLYFAGQLPLHLNYRDLAIPPSLGDLFKGITERITFESLKDYATNQFFRRDVFVKGRMLRDEAAANAYLESVPFQLRLPDQPLARDVTLPYQTLHFVGAIFEALSTVLATGAKTVTELSRAPELSAFPAERIREALVRLALAGQVTPTIASTRVCSVPALGEKLRVPSEYNRMMLRERLTQDAPIVLASAAAGTGLPITLVEAVALRLLTEVSELERGAWIVDFVQHHPFRLRVGERIVEDIKERATVLAEQVRPFREKKLPRLLELGIVERG